MIMMIARKNMNYKNRRIKAGEEFVEESPVRALALARNGNAEYKPDYSDSDYPKRTKRAYRRRDMQAEDA